MGYGHGPYGHGPYGHATVGITGLTVAAILAQMGIDDVESVAVSDDFLLIMRDPQPDEEGIAQGTKLRLRIVPLQCNPGVPGEGISGLTVWLNWSATASIDTPVFEYNVGVGTFPNADWQGAENAYSTHALGGPYCYLDVTVDHDPNLFDSEQVVQVYVKALDTLFNGTAVGWGSYSFQVEDVTPPSVMNAEPRDQFTVRICFDDDMATSGPGSALNADAYTINRENVDPEPAVNLEVVEVEQVVGSEAKRATTYTGFGPWDLSAELTWHISLLIDGVQWDLHAPIGGFSDSANVQAWEIAAYIRAAKLVYGTPVGAKTWLDDSVNPPQYRVAVFSLAEGSAGSIRILPAYHEPDLAVKLGIPQGLVEGQDQEFDLTTNWEQTPDAQYRITVDPSVTDSDGNGVT